VLTMVIVIGKLLLLTRERVIILLDVQMRSTDISICGTQRNCKRVRLEGMEINLAHSRLHKEGSDPLWDFET
jgi:hypothetical protein